MRVRLLAAIALVTGCVADNGFTCQDSAQCGTGGICEPTSNCSFADSSCPSGQRYGSEGAAGLRDTCVVGAADADAGPDGSINPGPDASPATPDAVPGTPDAVAKPDAMAVPDAKVSEPDADPLAPVARLISNAYFTNWNGPTYESSTGMSKTGFEISTFGVQNGDLLLFIASVDNGSPILWPNPIASGFTQITQQFYGNDGETFVADWKIADNEPATYSGVYDPGSIGSSSAVLSLIAVSNVDSTKPIDTAVFSAPSGSDMFPPVGTSNGVTTTRPNCTIIYASGVDWHNGSPGSNTFAQPAGYTMLTALGDHGNNEWDWSSQMIASANQAAIGPTGKISGTFNDSVLGGLAWTVVVAVAP